MSYDRSVKGCSKIGAPPGENLASEPHLPAHGAPIGPAQLYAPSPDSQKVKIPRLPEVDRTVRCRADPPRMGRSDLENVKGRESVWPAMGGLVLRRMAVGL